MFCDLPRGGGCNLVPVQFSVGLAREAAADRVWPDCVAGVQGKSAVTLYISDMFVVDCLL